MSQRNLLYQLTEPLRLASAEIAARTVAIAEQRPEETYALLTHHRLGPLWLHALKQAADFALPHSSLIQRLKEEAYRSACLQLLTDRMAARALPLLDERAIDYVVFKGFYLAYVLYEMPSLRPIVDLDLWVHSTQRSAAIAALQSSGLRGAADRLTATHEVCLSDGQVSFDLHWHLLRPGRLRMPLTHAALHDRKRYRNFWVPSDEVTSLILLLSPTFSEHVTSRLITAVDLDRWLRQRTIDWNSLISHLQNLGAKSAAWTMLVWTRRWFQTPVPSSVLAELAPPRPQAHLLERWLDRCDVSAEFQDPTRWQWALSLLFHDRLADAQRAVAQRCLAACLSGRQAKRLNQELGVL